MVYLLLAILCSTTIALLFKVSESRNVNRYLLTTTNYLFASFVSLFLWQMDVSNSWEIVRNDVGFVHLLLVAAFAGAVYYLGFLYYQISVGQYGVSLAGAFAKLGIFLPLVLSLLIWQEWPGFFQWTGIICATIAIFSVNVFPAFSGSFDRKMLLRPALLALFLFGGFAEFSSKVFRQVANPEHKSFFLMVLFFVAMLTSLSGLKRHRENLSGSAIALGLLVGIPNLLSAYFVILALGELPAAVVYAAFGAGTILLVGATGYWIWEERPRMHEKVGFVLIVIALIISNF